MALLYVFPNAEFIEFRNQNNEYMRSIHYSELSFGYDINANIQFSHRRDTVAVFPIQSAPFAEVVDKTGTPYAVTTINDFLAAFVAALPLSGTGSSGGGGGSNTNFAWEVIVWDSNIAAYSRRVTKFDSNTGNRIDIYSDFITGNIYSPAPSDIRDAIVTFDDYRSEFAALSGKAGSESMFYDTDNLAFVRKISKYNLSTGVTTDVYKDFVTGAEYTPDLSLLFDATYYQKIASENLINLIAYLNCATQKTTTQNIRGVGSFNVLAGVGATRVKVVALAGSTFSFGGVIYPLATAGSGTIVDIDISAGVGRKLGTVSYAVLTGTVLEIVEI